jgi:protein SCO1
MSVRESIRPWLGIGVIAAALTVAVAGCSSEGPGSYAAANPADCLPDVTLLDQHGNRVELDSLKGVPVLVDFVYTSCSQTCPLLTDKVHAVAKLLGPQLGTKVRIVSITIDPQHDGPPQLLQYARAHGATESGWLFLTGTEPQVQRVLGVYGIKISHAADGAIGHVTAAYLLGPNGHQVRQYEATEVSAETVVGDIERAEKRG